MCQQQLQQSQSAIGNVIASVTASSDCAMTTRDEQRQQHAQPTYRQHATDNGQCTDREREREKQQQRPRIEKQFRQSGQSVVAGKSVNGKLMKSHANISSRRQQH